MAVQMPKTDADTKVTSDEAYGRIDSAYGVLENNTVTATLNWYFNAAAAQRDDQGKPAGKPFCPPDVIELNTDEAEAFRILAITGLYEIIKARPEYAGAADV